MTWDGPQVHEVISLAREIQVKKERNTKEKVKIEGKDEFKENYVFSIMLVKADGRKDGTSYRFKVDSEDFDRDSMAWDSLRWIHAFFLIIESHR